SGTYPQLNPPFPIDAPAECEHVTTSRRPTGVLPLTEGRPMRPPLLALTAALLTAGLLTGCSADDTAARQPPPTVTPTATLTGTPSVTPTPVHAPTATTTPRIEVTPTPTPTPTTAAPLAAETPA